MSVKTTTTTPADSTPVASVDTFAPTDSNVSDRAAYVAAFGEITAGLSLFAQGSMLAGEGSRVGAVATLDLRESILRPDNGAPDWAGKTSAYTEALGTFLFRWAAENTYTGVDGKPAPITGDMVKTFKSRVSSYASDHQLLAQRMAEYEARTNSKAPATLTKVRAAFSAPAGTVLPPEVKQNVRAQVSKQVGFKSAKPFANFDPDLNLPQVSGRKPKPGTDSGTGDGNATATPSQAWTKVRRQIEKGDGGALRVDMLADEVLHVVSLQVLQIVGPIGEKVPAVDSLPGQGAGRAAAIATIARIGALCTTAVAALDSKDKTVKKDDLTDLLWNENPTTDS